MCFSASVSFAAAAFLGAQGVVAIRAAPTRRHLPLAAIPLVFAIQQACEGMLWRQLEATPFKKADSPFGYLFLFFAFAIWPAYLAICLALLERTRRRLGLGTLAAIGFVLGAYLLQCVSFRPTSACIAHGSLYYWVQVDTSFKALTPFAYLAVVSAPLLVSSMPGTSALALALAISFASSAWLGGAGFLSTWCFFAALLSSLVTLLLRAERRQSQTLAICRRYVI